MPDWYQGKEKAAPAEPLGRAVVQAVEDDERAVYYPPLVRALRVVHGISPKLADRMLKTMRGGTAAPRID
jgi:hypothetical protein